MVGNRRSKYSNKMDNSILNIPPQFGIIVIPHLIPYIVLTINYILFKLTRSFINGVFSNYLIDKLAKKNRKQKSWLHLLKILVDELISTGELCADCAELNVVYEKHGSLAYGASLFLLSYLWINSFGDAHTTPGYLFEDYFLVKGNELLKTGDAYARFIGQSIAIPLAWRFASFYWKYQLLIEHKDMLVMENCKTSLSTSTLNGLLIEFSCCSICRLVELIGHKLLENDRFSRRVISLSSSFICTLLVVVSLELSGGYFNPILAASLEYGCKGINFYQHAIVFWLGPLLGHVLARAIYRRVIENIVSLSQNQRANKSLNKSQPIKRSLRSNSQKQKSISK